MAQDVGMHGVNVLWCLSHLVWLVFEASIPTCTCFHEGKLFLTLYKVTPALFYINWRPQTDFPLYIIILTMRFIYHYNYAIQVNNIYHIY